MTAPVPAGPTDARGELREAWARKLFHEFVTGLPSAWTSDHGQNAHYRAECYRVVDELLADVWPTGGYVGHDTDPQIEHPAPFVIGVRDALAAQETVEEAERRGYERGKRETAEYLLRVAEGARQRAGDR